MNIILQSVHFKASTHLKAFVANKISKLFRLNNHILRAEVTLYEEAAIPLNQCCEIRLFVRGNDHFAQKTAATYEQSIVNTVHALRKIMRRNKTKKIGGRKILTA